MPKVKPPSASEEKAVRQEVKTVNSEEMKIPGPDMSGKTCAETGCSNAKHCAKNFLRSCKLKATYLNDIVATVNLAQDKAISPLHAKILREIPVTDILHDISKTNYFGLSINSRNAIDLVLESEPYVNQLAFLYFVILGHGKLVNLFPTQPVFDELHEKTAFTTKTAKLKTLAKGLDSKGRASRLTLKNVALAGAAMATVAAVAYLADQQLPVEQQAVSRLRDFYRSDWVPQGVRDFYREYTPDALKASVNKLYTKQEQAFWDKLDVSRPVDIRLSDTPHEIKGLAMYNNASTKVKKELLQYITTQKELDMFSPGDIKLILKNAMQRPLQ